MPDEFIPLQEAINLHENYIQKLGFHPHLKEGEESVYLTTKQQIIDAYNAGNRTVNILRAYIYLTSLE